MKIVAIIQARMGSTRLPGKVLMDIAGQTMLARVVNRVRRSTRIDETVIATTVSQSDEPVVAECQKLNVTCFRGSEKDVLDRYYQAALAYNAEGVVRITSDCPLTDPGIVDLVIREFFKKVPLDYASNNLPPRTFPRGVDVEVFSWTALERAWFQDHNPAWREHVTPFLYRNPQSFRLHRVINQTDYSSMRWTVDTTEDLALVRRVFEHFGHDGFSWKEVLNLVKQHPDWMEINRGIQQKEVP